MYMTTRFWYFGLWKYCTGTPTNTNTLRGFKNKKMNKKKAVKLPLKRSRVLPLVLAYRRLKK